MWPTGLGERAEVRDDPDTWGPPTRERERESWAGPTAGPGRGGRGDFLFFILVIYLFIEIE